MMLAIYRGDIYRTGDTEGDTLTLTHRENGQQITVSLADPHLVVDPIDAQVEAAQPFTPNPDPLTDQCAVCGKVNGYGATFLHLNRCDDHGGEDTGWEDIIR